MNIIDVALGVHTSFLLGVELLAHSMCLGSASREDAKLPSAQWLCFTFAAHIHMLATTQCGVRGNSVFSSEVPSYLTSVALASWWFHCYQQLGLCKNIPIFEISHWNPFYFTFISFLFLWHWDFNVLFSEYVPRQEHSCLRQGLGEGQNVGAVQAAEIYWIRGRMQACREGKVLTALRCEQGGMSWLSFILLLKGVTLGWIV